MSAVDQPQPDQSLALQAWPDRPPFYKPCCILDSVPKIPTSFPELARILSECLHRLQRHCILCYFLRYSNPIKVIQTSCGAVLDVRYDNHAGSFERCPSRLLGSPSVYRDFTYHASTSLRRSQAAHAGWSVCAACTEPYSDPLCHGRCIYGQELYVLSYLIWQHAPTRDLVFSLLHANNVPFPDLQDVLTYAEWLGVSVSSTKPALCAIHLVTVAYHLLRWVGQLPTIPYPDVEAAVVYQEKTAK